MLTAFSTHSKSLKEPLCVMLGNWYVNGHDKNKTQDGALSEKYAVLGTLKAKNPDLQVGFKPGGFYGLYQEIGTSKAPKIGALSDAAESNIKDIIKIEQQYLSAVGTEEAERKLNEGEYSGE